MAINEDVNIKVSADLAEAIQAWKEIENGPKALQDALEKIGELEGRTSDKWIRGLEGVVARWVSVGAAISEAKRLMDEYEQAQEKYRQEREDSTRTVDAAATRYFATTGIGRDTAEGQSAMQRIANAAVGTSSSPDVAFDAASLLHTFGSSDDATLRAYLQLQDTVVQTGGADPSRHVLDILRRSGMQVNAQNLQSLGGTAYSLLQSNQGFDLNQLQEFSGVATAARQGGVDMSTALSMWAALRSDENTKKASAEFRSLFDQNVKPGERDRIEELRARGAAIVSGQPYEAAQQAVDESVDTREQRAKTRQQFGLYTPGEISREEAANNLSSLLSSLGASDYARWRVESNFTDPLGPNFIYNTEARAEESVVSLLSFQYPQGNAPRGTYEKYVDQIMGRQPIQIRMQGPNGMDIPADTPVEQIGDPGAPAGF